MIAVIDFLDGKLFNCLQHQPNVALRPPFCKPSGLGWLQLHIFGKRFLRLAVVFVSGSLVSRLLAFLLLLPEVPQLHLIAPAPPPSLLSHSRRTNLIAQVTDCGWWGGVRHGGGWQKN